MAITKLHAAESKSPKLGKAGEAEPPDWSRQEKKRRPSVAAPKKKVRHQTWVVQFKPCFEEKGFGVALKSTSIIEKMTFERGRATRGQNKETAYYKLVFKIAGREKGYRY